MANSANPDQTAPDLGLQFAQAYLSKNLGSYGAWLAQFKRVK